MSRNRQWVAGSVVHGPLVQVSEVTGDVTITTAPSERPLYRVDAFPSDRPHPTTDRARAQPARLLLASYALVDFTGRAGELAALAAWRDESLPASVLLLHGPGGQGKTRLGAEFAAASRAAGWEVLQARHASDPSPGAEQTGSGPPVGTGVLLVADYAERWPEEDLRAMITDAARQGRQARVLLLARPAGVWWQTLAHRLDRLDLPTDALALPPLAQDADTDPESLFTAARDHFARALDTAGADAITPPDTLRDPAFGQVLSVHMAALAAVDAHRIGTETGALTSPGRVSAYLLDRERDHWRTLYANGRVTTPPATLAHAVYTAALTGAQPYDSGRDALLAIGACPSDRGVETLSDHAVAYPPATPHSGSVLEPLYPDRLAEDFVALTTPGHHLDHFAPDPWASTAPQRLLAHDGTKPPAWARPALTVLIAAAARWPHLAGQLAPLLVERPELALYAGGAVLGALAGLEALPIEALAAVEARFPPGRHTDLDSGMAALTRHLIRRRLDVCTDLTQRALLLGGQSLRFANAGWHKEALVADLEAVTAHRKLAEAGLDLRERDYAASLNNLSNGYQRARRFEDALAVVEEAIEIWRKLVAADPAFSTSELAVSLSNLSNVLGHLGRWDEGLAASEEATELWRRRAATDPLADEPNFAGSLNNLSNQYAREARWDESLAAIDEALAMWRRMASANPAAFEPDLAMALHNRALKCGAMGRKDEALRSIDEAIVTRRRLVEAAPTAHEPSLASSLWLLARLNLLNSLLPEALAAADEALEMYRRLDALSPGAFAIELREVLATREAVLAGLDRP
ncbi:tetratricopeptide repeat protein [Streptomyces liangshanensis]|uniref:Tetratricopeptide repeat protein n=1 Tax=Streptomyces liangshanensis TaxID=2717324 RepID=A0A6G9GYZ0_9ACTN|nr:tetratricopeptide repeat protein [Streptomyces liangshanensis]QIQ03201.1 tetratricopeptide repeat protein [Streptomyces liangshanensis]